MIEVKIETNIPRRIRIPRPKFFDIQMGRLAATGLASIKGRVSKGIGANDQQMPPLKRGYAIQKSKQGKGNRRNLSFTGAMLDNLTVRSANSREARIALTKASERTKALANQLRSPWLGWSANDIRTVMGVATQIWKTEVTVDVFKTIKGIKRVA